MSEAEAATQPVHRHFQVASPTTAVGLTVLIAVVGAVDLVLASHTHQLGASTTVLGGLVAVTVTVGLLVAVRQPRNAIGWCLLGVPFFAVVTNGASTYSVLDYRMRHGTLPLGAVAVMLQPAWAPTIFLFVFALLIFPDGVVPSGLLRWVTLGMVSIGAVWVIGALGIAVTTITQHHVHVDGGGSLLAIDHPRGAWRWWGVVDTWLFPMSIASLVLWGVSQVPKYRRSTGDRRLQLKWLYGGALMTICAASVAIGTSGVGQLPVAVHILVIALIVGGVAALPISIGVGILKYRLYDIDRLMSRTLAYAIVTGVVVGLYVGLITLVTRVLGFSSPVAVAASTLAAVALFNPLRVRVQHVVDRRFNRARYDAEATVAAFTARLRDAVDLETVRSELLQVVNRAVEPAHASVWIKQHKAD